MAIQNQQLRHPRLKYSTPKIEKKIDHENHHFKFATNLEAQEALPTTKLLTSQTICKMTFITVFPRTMMTQGK